MKTTRLILALLLLTAAAAQAQFDYITYNGAAIITGYSGPGGAVSIPSTLGGLPVTEIQGSGFENKGITSVAISESVTNIEAQEFAPNYFLTSFTVDTNNPAYAAVGGVLFSKDLATLVEYPPGISGTFSIPGTVTSIGPNAFAASYYLTGVTIPATVTNIGSTAFGYCFDLTNVTIPTSVTGIAPDTFINCEQLTAISVAAGNQDFSSVGGVLFDKNAAALLEFPTGLTGSYAIPAGVTTIGTDAFVLCNGLTNISMPASVTTIEDSAFGDCAGLTTLTLGAGINSLSTEAFGGCVNLAAINVNPTNALFSSLNGVVFNKNQTTLLQFPPGFTAGYTVPNSVTSIADYAFEGCRLSDVTISSNIASIGLDSLQGCGNLTNVTMLSGVTSIGIFAFADDPKLATVTIPATVMTIDFGAFDYDGLTSVYFQGNAPPADESIFEGDSGTIYYLAGTSGWGTNFDGLTTEIEDAPNPNGSLEVTILPPAAAASGAQWQVDGGLLQPSDATVLGLSVGQHTVSFTTINGWMAPASEMVSVTANTTNTATGTYMQQSSPASDFTYFTNAGDITITGYTGPGGSVDIPSVINSLPVTDIAEQAFANGSTLTSITIPDSVTNLGDYAFSSCQDLEEITISENISSIGFGTFEDCFSLSDVTFRGAITNISDFGFSSCPELSSLAIPATLTSLGQYAFFGGGLTNVNIPAGLTNIGEAAFLFCNFLPAITVDSSNPAYASVAGVLFNKSQAELLEYPDGNFQSSYSISSNVTSIGDLAFDSCVLSTISIPDSVTNIGNYSFESCGSLSGVTIPGSVTSIGNAAFAQCAGLAGIVLPASVINFGQAPFANCVNMTAINTATNNPAFSSANGVLYNKAGTLLVEYPGGPTGSFTIPSGVGDVGTEAFSGCQLNSVTIPASVTNIEIDGFFNSSLQSVKLAEGLATIGAGAFESCYNLASVALPSSVTSIGFAAFSSCSALTSVFVPAAARDLGSYAFAFDNNLATAVFSGVAPPDDGTVFDSDSHATVYYSPEASGWGPMFGSVPTKPLPEITRLSATGANLVIDATNGQSGVSYIVLASTNLAQPLNKWTPVATNLPSVSGNFSVTVTNAINAQLPQRFYILQSTK